LKFELPSPLPLLIKGYTLHNELANAQWDTKPFTYKPWLLGNIHVIL